MFALVYVYLPFIFQTLVDYLEKSAQCKWYTQLLYHLGNNEKKNNLGIFNMDTLENIFSICEWLNPHL